jgi:hypothetical protein
MVNKLAQVTVGNILLIHVDSDPSVGGYIAPIGSMLFTSIGGVGKHYLKFGIGNNDYRKLADQADIDALSAQITSGSSGANAYTDSKISALIDSAPAVLDTLRELSVALNNDPDFANHILALVTAETARATNAEVVLTTNLSSEVSRATSAESVIASNLSSEITRAGMAEVSNSNAISAEISRATSAEGIIASNLSSEITRAQNAEASNASNISSEITRATNAEGVIASSLSAEISRAESAEVANTNAISAEISRATSAEGIIASNLSSEITRAQNAEASNASNISSEITRATNAEEVIASNLASEISRATSAEGVNASNIASEVSRAQAVEALKASLVKVNTQFDSLSVVSSATLVQLTSSVRNIGVSGTIAQTLKLPQLVGATDIFKGSLFVVKNISNQLVTVQDFSGNIIASIPASHSVAIRALLSGVASESISKWATTYTQFRDSVGFNLAGKDLYNLNTMLVADAKPQYATPKSYVDARFDSSVLSTWQFASATVGLNSSASLGMFGNKVDFDISFYRDSLPVMKMVYDVPTSKTELQVQSRLNFLDTSSVIKGSSLQVQSLNEFIVNTDFNRSFFVGLKRDERSDKLLTVINSGVFPDNTTFGVALSNNVGKHRKAKVTVMVKVNSATKKYMMVQQTIHVDEYDFIVLQQDDMTSRSSNASSISVVISLISGVGGSYEAAVSGLDTSVSSLITIFVEEIAEA